MEGERGFVGGDSEGGSDEEKGRGLERGMDMRGKARTEIIIVI